MEYEFEIKEEIQEYRSWPFTKKVKKYAIYINGKFLETGWLSIEEVEDRIKEIKECIEFPDYIIYENGLGDVFIKRKRIYKKYKFSYERLPMDLNSVEDAEAWIETEEKRNEYKEVKRIWKDDPK